jgi:hypothetical protein
MTILTSPMHKKRIVAIFSFIFVLVLLVSSVSAFWPFDSLGKKTSITGNAISYSANLPLCIGYELGTGGCTDGQAFTGYIDEIRIYSRALTNTEAISLSGLNAPSDSLVGYWNFDSSSTPSLQNNARVVVDPAGSALDLVLQLDGTNQFAQVPYTASLQPGETISFSAWFKSNDYTKSQRILSAVQGGGYGLVLNDPYGTCRGDTLCAIVRVGSSYVTAQVARSQLPAALYGGWYQSVATYDGTTLKLYVNGRQVDPAPATTTTVQRGAECDARTGLQNTRTCTPGLTCQDTNGDGIGACRAPAGQACSISSDCLSGYGLTCINNLCTTSPSTVTVGLGQECNMREVPNKKICSSDATCQDTNDDGLGACRHAVGLSCAQDSDCLSGIANTLKCIANVCTVQTSTIPTTPPTTTPTTGKQLGEICTANSECANDNCYGNVCTRFSLYGGGCDSTTNRQGAGIFGMTCKPQVGLTCVATDCICAGHAVWSDAEGRCVVFSNYITDASVRGYVGEGPRTLVLGFKTPSTTDLTATVDRSWTAPQALSADLITTGLTASSGSVGADVDTTNYGVKSGITPGTYGLYASASGNAGQAVLATTGSNIIFSQFSARGYADANTLLILGFTVIGDHVNLDIQAHPEKLPQEFSPKLADFTYDIILYNASSVQLYRSSNSIGPRLGPGKYTVVVQPKDNASGFMLLEILDGDTSMPSSGTSSAITDIPTAPATQTSTSTTSTSTTGTAASGSGTATATATSASTNTAVVCTGGCLSANGQTCHVEGFRSGSRYCDSASRSFVSQKTTDDVCANAFECSSNICVSNKCVDASLFQRFLQCIAHPVQCFSSE